MNSNPADLSQVQSWQPSPSLLKLQLQCMAVGQEDVCPTCEGVRGLQEFVQRLLCSEAALLGSSELMQLLAWRCRTLLRGWAL